MFERKKYGSGSEGDTRIVLNQEEEIRKLELARLQITKQIEDNIKEYVKLIDASGSEKKKLQKRAGRKKVGKAANDFSGIKK